MARANLTALLVSGGMLLVLVAPASSQGRSPIVAQRAASIVASGLAHSPEETAADKTPSVAPVLARAGIETPEANPVETKGPCASDMVEVEGEFCKEVEQKCLRWVDPEGTVPRRCAQFAPTTRCRGKAQAKHFCIDKFEYPNRPGQKPDVMKTWHQASASCTKQGKRLCKSSEWTLACEGRERLPYPYGYARNAEACNIDKPHPDVNEKALANPKTRAAEVERLWQGEPSGSRDSCKSPYGVFDMTGNVDEWVVNESGAPFKSGLKGGYWGPVRDRCRPMTTAHNEDFQFYQIGFRCCGEIDTDANGAAPKAPGGQTTNTQPSALTGI